MESHSQSNLQDARAVTRGDLDSAPGETDCVRSSPAPDKPGSSDWGSAFTGTLGGKRIWVDLRLPDPDGEVSGIYLYAKHGKDIPLTGARNGSTLELKEGNPGKVTGEFHLELRSPDSEGAEYWKGAWNKPGGKRSLPVRLFPTRADFKGCHLADPESLIMAEGRSFAQEMASHLPEEDPDAQPPSSLDRPLESILEVRHCSEGLMGVTYTWFHYPGFDPTMRHTELQWTFDLARKREIQIYEEIDSTKRAEFNRLLAEKLIPHLAWMRQTLNEESEDIGSVSSVEAPSEVSYLSPLEVSIDGGELRIGRKNYFELSERQMALSKCGNGEAWIKLSPEEMQTFLRKGSALRNLVPKP